MNMEENKTQAIDLSCYRWDGTWEWLKEAESTEEGSKKVMAQIGWLSEKIRAMKIGERLSILQLCSNPAYYSVAVKIACVVILSWQYADRKEMRDYSFNSSYTEIRRVS